MVIKANRKLKKPRSPQTDTSFYKIHIMMRKLAKVTYFEAENLQIKSLLTLIGYIFLIGYWKSRYSKSFHFFFFFFGKSCNKHRFAIGHQNGEETKMMEFISSTIYLNFRNTDGKLSVFLSAHFFLCNLLACKLL